MTVFVVVGCIEASERLVERKSLDFWDLNRNRSAKHNALYFWSSFDTEAHGSDRQLFYIKLSDPLHRGGMRGRDMVSSSPQFLIQRGNPHDRFRGGYRHLRELR